MTDMNDTPLANTVEGLQSAPANAQITRRAFDHAITTAHDNGDLDVQQTLLALLGAINALETTLMAFARADTRRLDGTLPPDGDPDA